MVERIESVVKGGEKKRAMVVELEVVRLKRVF
jgi:hypothetical protein